MRSTTAVVNTNEYINEHHLDLNMFATDVLWGCSTRCRGRCSISTAGIRRWLSSPRMARLRISWNQYRPGGGHVTSGAEFEIMDAHLEPGDILLGYTDGVTDARKPAGEAVSRGGLLSLISTRRSKIGKRSALTASTTRCTTTSL